MEFESSPHRHVGRMSKAELARHLTTPHKTAYGWSSMHDGQTALRKWSRRELEQQHAEFHGEE